MSGEDELGRVLDALDAAAFEPDGSPHGLRPLGPCPGWARELVLDPRRADEAPFLEDFLTEARAVWDADAPGRVRSDAWMQALGGAEPRPLEALAARDADGRRTLLVRRAQDFEVQRQVPLQAARDALLARRRLLKEIDKKELLLHGIVHDLKGPLAGMLGSFALLARGDLPGERERELVRIGDEQARRQQALIEGLLDLFAAEVSELEGFETDPARAPDLAAAAALVARVLGPAFEGKGVALSVRVEPGAEDRSWKVHGRRQGLERVLGNLLENALRHAPAGSAVTVRLGPAEPDEDEDPTSERLRASVEDAGPGVPEELAGCLFEPLARGPGGGSAGLGLAFVRATVERWGGRVGHEPARAGSEGPRGARFWLELPAATGLEPGAGEAR